ncbi:MAG: hypothetical protein QXP81_06965 [Nitrososphaerota archaeon]
MDGRGRFFKPVFLFEKEVSKYLQSIYVAITASRANAEAIVGHDPDDLTPNMGGGHGLAKRSFSYLIGWLRNVHEYSASDEIFSRQIYEPVRLAAGFRLSVSTTTTLSGYVFSKSAEFYDPFFGENVIDLSMIVPSLGSAMCLRCRADFVRDLNPGMYIVGSVQPIPFVNRIHPVHLSIRDSPDELALSELDALKTSLYDFRRYADSVAFENFCRVTSRQLLDKRRGGVALGAVRVVSGILSDVRVPLISIAGSFNRGTGIQLVWNGDSRSVEALRGKPVRALAVIWYGKKGYVLPEAFIIEPAASSLEVIEDDIIGFVGSRLTVDPKTLRHRYPGVDPLRLETNRLGWEGGCLIWKQDTSGTGDDVVTGFLRQRLSLMRIRSGMPGPVERAPLVPWTLVLDRQKLHIRGAVDELRRNGSITSLMMELVRLRENGDELPKSIKQLGLTDEDVRWLRVLGFIKKVKAGGVLVTERGVGALYELERERITGWLGVELQQRGFISVPDAEAQLCVPTSLILRGLDELKRNTGIRPLRLNHVDINIIWVREDDINSIEAARGRLSELKSKVLSVLRSKPHGLAVSRIREALGGRFSTPAIEDVLRALRICGKVLERDGVWVYPEEVRILDVLSEAPDRFFSYQELMEKAGIPPVREENTRSLLRSLVRRGAVDEMRGELWAIKTNDPDVLRRRDENLLRSDCKRQFLEYLKRVGRTDVLTATAKMRIFISHHRSFRPGSIKDIDRLADEMLHELAGEGYIRLVGNTVEWAGR